MSRLSRRKTKLQFTTDETVRYRGRRREIVVQATPYLATVRLAGTRTQLEVSWGGVYNLAAKLAAEQRRREKKAGRPAAGS